MSPTTEKSHVSDILHEVYIGKTVIYCTFMEYLKIHNLSAISVYRESNFMWPEKALAKGVYRLQYNHLHPAISPIVKYCMYSICYNYSYFTLAVNFGIYS